MSGGEDPNLEKNLRVALETRTTLTELQTLLEMLRQGEPVPKESPLFLARDGREDQLGRDFTLPPAGGQVETPLRTQRSGVQRFML